MTTRTKLTSTSPPPQLARIQQIAHATWDGPVPGGHQYTLKNLSVFSSDQLRQLERIGGQVEFAHSVTGDLVVQCRRTTNAWTWLVWALLLAAAILAKDVLKEYTGRPDLAWLGQGG